MRAFMGRMIPPMGAYRNNDDIIRRVRQRAEEERRPRLPLPSTEPIDEWFQAVFDLLTDMRRNLPIFIDTSEWLLESVVIPGDPSVGRGRKKRGRECPQSSAGWRLSTGTVTHFDTRIQDTRQVTDTYRTYLLIDGRLLGLSIIADDKFPAMLDSPQVTEMIVTLYTGAGLSPPRVPPLPEALRSRDSLAIDQLRITTEADALYAFRAQDGAWRGHYDQLPDGQFGTGVLSFHPPGAHRSQFYGQNLQVRYGHWDGPVSFHTLMIYSDGGEIRMRATSEVISRLFDQR